MSEISIEPEKTSLNDFLPIPENELQYPVEYIRNYSAIKLKEDDNCVFIGISKPFDEYVIENLQNFHKKKTRFFEIEKSELAAYLGKKQSYSDDEMDINSINSSDKHLLDKIANDAPIINLVNSILIEAISSGASDIHIEAFSDEAIVRYRIDGALQIHNKIKAALFPGVSSRIKVMANLNIMERRLPQDGRITVDIGDTSVDLRVSIVPIARGESIVLRLLNKKSIPLKLTDLGFDKPTYKTIKELVNFPHGLVLVTGPTGCGKTTTLNAVLREINSEDQKVITIEDPIEFVIDGVTQIQTNERIGLTFDSILRRVLRQDPNIIMVGEIRDPQTAELAIKAALTGHLVLSTLHTNDAVSVIPRLKNMGLEPYLIAAVLRGALAQRLIRKICPKCKTEIKPSTADKEYFLSEGIKTNKLYQGTGCKECNNTGYKGRLSISEIFVCNEELEYMISHGERVSEIRKHLNNSGMKSMKYNGLKLASEGITTLYEVEKAVNI